MTRTFARPCKAMYDYEASLRHRPASWPLTRHDAPTLWGRAKAFFAAMLASIVSIADLARRAVLPPAERRAILAQLQPVENLARLLMLGEAMAWLMNDPAGQRLRATAKPAPVPEPRVRKLANPNRIWLGATLAICQPRIDPRIAEREAREAALKRASAGDLDPGNWDCRFRTLRWVMPESDAPKSRTRFYAMSLEDDLPTGPPRRIAQHNDTDGDEAPRAVARRIEALARVLADPAPFIRRLARQLATLPAAYLSAPNLHGCYLGRWRHGAREAIAARDLAFPIWREFVGLTRRPLEPG